MLMLYWGFECLKQRIQRVQSLIFELQKILRYLSYDRSFPAPGFVPDPFR